jgi:hypothetical protein
MLHYCSSIKPGAVSVDLESQKDAANAGKSDAGGGGMLRTSRICYAVVLATAFWASVLYLRSVTQGDNGGGETSVVLSNPSSALSIPLLSGITGGGRRPPFEQPPSVSDGKAAPPAPADRCAGRNIYLYDLPPRFNADLVRGCSKLRPWMDLCPYVANCGMGQALRDDEGGVSPAGRGWYATDQFMLDVIFHFRMQRYACLTDDDAAVFVPFYASLDGGRHLWNSTAARDALALDLVAWLARRGRARPLPGGGTHHVGLPSGDRRRRGVGHQAAQRPRRPQHDGAGPGVQPVAPRGESRGAVPDGLPPGDGRRRGREAGEGAKRGARVALLLRRLAVAGEREDRACGDHPAVRRVEAVHEAVGQRAVQLRVFAAHRDAADGELDVLPAAERGHADAAVHVRRCPRRVRPRVLPPPAYQQYTRHLLSDPTSKRSETEKSSHHFHSYKFLFGR